MIKKLFTASLASCNAYLSARDGEMASSAALAELDLVDEPEVFFNPAQRR